MLSRLETPRTDQTMNPKPSIGRIVHYILPAGVPNVGKHRAAIITEANDDSIYGRCRLAVFMVDVGDLISPDAITAEICSPGVHPISHANDATYDGTAKIQGTWHWPERE